MAHLTASRTLPVAGRSTTVSLGDRLAAVFAIWRQRRALASLPDHLRQDVGLTEAEIDREARRHSGTSRSTGGSEPGSGGLRAAPPATQTDSKKLSRRSLPSGASFLKTPRSSPISCVKVGRCPMTGATPHQRVSIGGIHGRVSDDPVAYRRCRPGPDRRGPSGPHEQGLRDHVGWHAHHRGRGMGHRQPGGHVRPHRRHRRAARGPVPDGPGRDALHHAAALGGDVRAAGVPALRLGRPDAPWLGGGGQLRLLRLRGRDGRLDELDLPGLHVLLDRADLPRDRHRLRGPQPLGLHHEARPQRHGHVPDHGRDRPSGGDGHQHLPAVAVR
jgi:uncharacterized protein YjiS (DUF1127 family)